MRPLSIIKAYEDRKSKGHSKDRADNFLSNSEVFSLQTNFCSELEQLAVHLRRFLRAYETAACKLNVMFFNNLCSSPEVLRTPKKVLERELD